MGHQISGIRKKLIPDPDPDSEVKKAPDPVSTTVEPMFAEEDLYVPVVSFCTRCCRSKMDSALVVAEDVVKNTLTTQYGKHAAVHLLPADFSRQLTLFLLKIYSTSNKYGKVNANFYRIRERVRIRAFYETEQAGR
jgi:hypothetical protein